MEQISFLTDETNTRLEIDALKQQVSNIRKGLFKRHNILEEQIKDLKKEIKKIKGEEPDFSQEDMFQEISMSIGNYPSI